MKTDGITQYVKKMSTRLFKYGYTGVDLDNTIDVIHQDLEDRFEAEMPYDVIVKEFGRIEDIIEEYDIKINSGSYLQYIRWFITIMILLVPTIFIGASLSYFRYPFSGQFVSVKVFAAIRSNLLFLLAFAYYWFNTRIHNWSLTNLSKNDPRYRFLSNINPWKLILPLMYLLATNTVFLIQSTSIIRQSEGAVFSYLVLLSKLLIFSVAMIYLYLQEMHQEREFNVIYFSHVIMFGIVLPQITWIPLFENLDFSIFEIITDQGSSGNSTYQTSVGITAGLIFGVIWIFTPGLLALLALYQIKRGLMNYKFPWMIGNIYFFSAMLKNQFGSTFKNQFLYELYGDNIGDEYLGYNEYGRPLLWIISGVVIWNIIMIIIHQMQVSTPLEPIIEKRRIFNLKPNAIRIIPLILILVILITSPSINFRGNLEFSSGTTDERFDNGDQSGFMIGHTSNNRLFLDIPQSGNVLIMFMIPKYSNFLFNLTWLENDKKMIVTEKLVEIIDLGDHQGLKYDLIVTESIEIEMEYNLTIFYGNPNDLELSLQTYAEWNSSYLLSGWLHLWFGMVMLLGLSIYVRKINW